MFGRLPRLYVILAADTEDNHPRHVPGWWRYGSDYDKNPPRLRFDWLAYLDRLWDSLQVDDTRFGVTWFLRVDPAVGCRCLDAMSNLIDKASEADDELAVHPHALKWCNNTSKWMQCTKQDICRGLVSASLDIFKNHLGKSPLSARMGWNYMNNATMQQLETEGVLYDASCIPGLFSGLMYGERDGFFDWSRASSFPFHPSYDDYQLTGDMRILEIPVTTYAAKTKVTEARDLFPLAVRALATFSSHRILSRGMSFVSIPPSIKRLMFRDEIFIFSPWRSNANLSRLLDWKVAESLANGWAYLLGYFHPCELLNPVSGKPDQNYLSNFKSILRRILLINDRVRVIPTRLSEFGRAYQDGLL